MPDATAQDAELKSYYDGYFASDAQLDWYALCAVDKARHVIDRAASVSPKTIVDIGCGDGAVLLRLDQANFGAELTAADVSASGLTALKQKPFRRLKEAVHFEGYTLPFADDQFDLAILSHVVEHLEHPRLLLHEAARVAKHLYVEVPLELKWRSRGLRGDFAMDDAGHINFYNPHLIRLLLQTSGLELLQHKIVLFSKVVHARGGATGTLNYHVKSTALKLWPDLATGLFTYESSILCRKDPKSPFARR